MIRVQAVLATAFALTWLSPAQPVLAQAAPADPRFQAMAQLTLGNYQGASATLDGAYQTTIADPDVQYLWGRCHLGQGNLKAARRALEMVLVLDPRADQARLLLAQIDVAEGDKGPARSRYQAILANNPPASVARQIERALSNLDEQKAWNAEVSVGLIYDSNVNAGPSDGQITVFGLPFTLSDASLEQDSVAVQFGAGVERLVFRGGDTSFSLGAGADYADYTDRSDFDVAGLSLSGALQHRTEALSAVVAPRVSVQWLGHDFYRSAAGLNTQLRRVLSRTASIDLGLGASYIDFDAASGRDGWRTFISPALTFGRKNVQVRLAYVVQNEDTEEAFRANLSHGPRADIAVSFGAWQSIIGYGYAHAEYEEIEPGFGIERADGIHSAHAGLSRFVAWPDNARPVRVGLDASYTRASSNIPLYDYNRLQVSLTVARAW